MDATVEVAVELEVVEVEVVIEDLVEMARAIFAKAVHNHMRPSEEHVSEWRTTKCRNKVTCRCFRAT